MSYTAIDLLDKVIYTAEKKKTLCHNTLEKLEIGTPIYMLRNVLAKNLDKSIEYYKSLKKEIYGVELEEIDFVIYDKISFLINEFNQKMIIPNVVNIKGLMEFCLDFQKDVLAVYIDIRGRLVKNKKDIETKTYEIICNMIIEKEKIIGDLEEFIKKYS